MQGVRMTAAAVLAMAVICVISMTSASAGHEATAPGDPVNGKKVYLNSNPKCSLCHTIGASGGKFGPDLSAVGKRRDAVWLARYLPNPKFENPANKMPAVAAKGKDLEDLIAYLVSLKGK